RASATTTRATSGARSAPPLGKPRSTRSVRACWRASTASFGAAAPAATASRGSRSRRIQLVEAIPGGSDGQVLEHDRLHDQADREVRSVDAEFLAALPFAIERFTCVPGQEHVEVRPAGIAPPR